MNFWRFPAFYLSYFSTFFSFSSDSFKFFSIFGRFLVALLIAALSFSIFSFNSLTFFSNSFCLSWRLFNNCLSWASFSLSPEFYDWEAFRFFDNCSIYFVIFSISHFDWVMWLSSCAFSLSKFWTSRRNVALGITSIYFLLLIICWRSYAKLHWTSSLTFFFWEISCSLWAISLANAFLFWSSYSDLLWDYLIWKSSYIKAFKDSLFLFSLLLYSAMRYCILDSLILDYEKTTVEVTRVYLRFHYYLKIWSDGRIVFPDKSFSFLLIQ